mgnify:CR=1 FL=1
MFSGSYMFMEASAPRKPGDVAELYNDQIKLTADSCLSFWYHMYGRDIGSLAVYNTTNPTPKLLWAQSGDKKNNWLNARVSDMV